MRYRRDVARDDRDAIEAETLHIRAHLSACVDPDDDEHAHADAVRILVTDHADGDPDLVSIIGEVDAEPDAPYLHPDYVSDSGDPAAELLSPALDRDAVDLDAEAYVEHMAAKEQR